MAPAFLSFCVSLLIARSYCGNIEENIIDIGHKLSPNSPVLPERYVEPFQLEPIVRGFLEDGWHALNEFTYTTFVGTNFAAPYLYYEFGWKVDEVPQEHLFAPVSVIDVSEKVAEDPLYEVTEEDIDDWIFDHGPFPNNGVILFRTGWDEKYYEGQEAYFGVEGNLTFPSLSEKAARKLLTLEKDGKFNFYGVGIDCGCINSPKNPHYVVQQLLGFHNKYVLQSLYELERVPATGARILVAPLKVRGASGVPTRVFVNLPSSKKDEEYI